MLGLNIYLQVVGAVIGDDLDLSAEAMDPPVITFAPPVVKVGDKLSEKSTIQLLTDAGLTKIEDDRPLGPGSFRWASPHLTLRPDFPGQADTVRISFAKGKISSIHLEDVSASTTELPPKPITSLSHRIEGASDEEQFLKAAYVYRIPARGDELDGSVVQLVLCTSEGGCGLAVDLSGIVRATFKNLENLITKDGRVRQGGSGICSQVVKNLLSDHSPRLSRKLQEFAVCNDLVRRIRSAKLFEAWANFTYYGESKNGRRLLGLQTAAHEVFGTRAQDLDLKQSVFLAALVSEPRLLRKTWKPDRDKAAWQKLNAKRELIADNVARKHGDRFSKEEIEAAKTWEPKFIWDRPNPKRVTDQLSMPIIQLAADEFPIYREKKSLDSLQIDLATLNRRIIAVTSISEELNIAAQAALRRRLPALQKRFPPIDRRTKKRSKDTLVGVIAAMENGTGRMITLAVVGADPKLSVGELYVNHKLSPASQFKSALYGCALDQELITPTSFLDPRQAAIRRLDGSVWHPRMGVGDRIITTTEAQASSNDGASVVITEALGLERTAECWRAFSGNMAVPNVSQRGEREYPAVLSLGFGRGMDSSVLDFLKGYSAFARAGITIRPRLLRKVTIAGDNVPLDDSGRERMVFSPEAAYIQAWALRNVVGVGPFGNVGTAYNMKFSDYLRKHPEIEFACKTGSGAAALGITCVSPGMTVSIQIFYKNGSFFQQTGGYAFASSSAGPPLSDFMLEVVKRRPELVSGKFAIPKGINFRRIDLARNCQDDLSDTSVPFIRGTEPDDCPSDFVK